MPGPSGTPSPRSRAISTHLPRAARSPLRYQPRVEADETTAPADGRSRAATGLPQDVRASPERGQDVPAHASGQP
jgi:hypothetical protein